MRQNWRLNSLLMEIIIAVLFFALCAGVIVNTLATSSYQGGKAGQMTEMLDTAQNVADCLYDADDMAEELIRLGFEIADGEYVRSDKVGTLTVALSREETESGELRVARIDAATVSGGEMQLSSVRFVPGEVR